MTDDFVIHPKGRLDMSETTPAWAHALRDSAEAWVARYHRHEVIVDAPIPGEPALIVGNHGFGGIFDLNVIAMSRTLRRNTPRGLTYLVHQAAWTMGVGWLVEPLGCLQASAENASAGFGSGHHVVVFPGGDIEAGKPWQDRNKVMFGNRCGFARLAIEQGVPIVPVVTAGAGESLFVISDGQELAARLGMTKHFRLKTLPISLTFPWGLNAGLAGLAPYVPLPSKLVTAVLPPMRPLEGEDGTAFAARVESAMQQRMNELVAQRRFLLG